MTSKRTNPIVIDEDGLLKRRKPAPRKSKCSFSLCGCNQDTCTVREAGDYIMHQRLKPWNEFLSKHDPNYKQFRKRLSLCVCHFVGDEVTFPETDHVIMNMAEEIKKLRKEKEELMDKFGIHFTKAQVNHLIYDKRTWDPETYCKASNTLEKIGEKSYNHLLSLGYPFPHPNTVIHFNTNVRKGVDGEIVEAIKNMEEEEQVSKQDNVSNSNSVATHVVKN